ncbi:tyrosinase family oxidase copper chaperone [Streptomyces sp. S.PNR 29]|uniref:tyrosinase family oxidase copper chaperone n=1 Tax=Streptomyces sp. S.PNR 29 TaxID=2973805 RepID=UPI0025AF5A7D|nr:tyrosinase family oxidase copper chaperone [Streptomyces sp. S.PNR 29]MDN0196920.1 tyrosinase cofactor [Streptomyces sp. S.PNR 29]
MVVSVGEVPGGAEDGAPGPERPGPAGRTRRDLVRGLRNCALTAVLASAFAAFLPPRPGPGRAPVGTGFEATYRGRRIRGVWIPGRGTAEDGQWQVTVDGRPLHLMRRADGTWLSMVDHYCSYRTPLEAARAAVDELGPGQRLRVPAPEPADGGHLHMGHRHGVRA